MSTKGVQGAMKYGMGLNNPSEMHKFTFDKNWREKRTEEWMNPISHGKTKDAPAATTPGMDPALDPNSQAAREEEIRKKLRLSGRGGRASTFLTSAFGPSKMGGSPTKKVLFGE